ncbi:TPA: hypothetical protein ACG1RN_004009 [Klebsiella oxytoca]
MLTFFIPYSIKPHILEQHDVKKDKEFMDSPPIADVDFTMLWKESGYTIKNYVQPASDNRFITPQTRTNAMTPEILLLRGKINQLSEITEYIELELTDNPQWEAPSDTSYLNEKDWADPDIVDNVRAMQATNKLISWFGEDNEGYVGLWRGPDDIPLEQAQVVRLDSEGQYELVADTIANYLAISCDEDEFPHIRQLLTTAGFSVANSIDEIWQRIDDSIVQPNDYRNQLYNDARILRGEDPVE